MLSMHAAFNRGIDAALSTLGFEKTAVSAEMLERVMRELAARGRIGPRTLQRVLSRDLYEETARKALTPEARSRMRNLVLYTGDASREAARGAAAVERAAQNPITQGVQKRVGEAWEAAMADAPGVRSTQLLPAYYDHGVSNLAGARFGYTPEHAQRVMGVGAEFIDPKKLMASSPAAAGVERTGIAPYHPMTLEKTHAKAMVKEEPPPPPLLAAPSRPAAPGDSTIPGGRRIPTG